ncbi:MAG: SAM-dependent methyltransferase [Maricaulaceae bacterium]
MSDRAEETAQRYYDSADANAFYLSIWGGEDIHVGLYNHPDEDVKTASRRTVDRLLGHLGDRPAGTPVADLGAVYGGAARVLASERGWRVACVNIAANQNAINRELNAKAGLDALITVHEGSFNAVPLADASVDVVWSQDAFLHGANRAQIIQEAARILRPGGDLVFTDPMRAVDARPEDLEAILRRIHLDDLATVPFYCEAADAAGLRVVSVEEHPDQLGAHYARVRAVLSEKRGQISAMSAPYLNAMLDGLGHWVEGAAAGRLTWAILHFRKPG